MSWKQPSKVGPDLSAQDAKVSCHHQRAVGLEGQRINTPRAWIKCGIQRAVWIQPGEVLDRLAGDAVEISSDDDLAIGLQCEQRDIVAHY